MSWKFWNWFHRGEVLQQSAKRAENSRGNPPGSRNSDSRESEDILMSISELIEGKTDEVGAVVPPIRATESFQFSEVIRATDTVKASDIAHDTKEIAIRSDVVSAEASQTSQPVAVIQPVNKVPTPPQSPPAEKPQVQKAAPETAASKRAEPPKEIMRTLVVEDGHWPMLKGLSESFKDLDDDDSDRPAFKTIVPNDE